MSATMWGLSKPSVEKGEGLRRKNNGVGLGLYDIHVNAKYQGFDFMGLCVTFVLILIAPVLCSLFAPKHCSWKLWLYAHTACILIILYNSHRSTVA